MKSPNGIAFSEFRSYETWETAAPSQTEGGIKVILANGVMIKAYKKGIPNNGEVFPEGSVAAKMEWSKRSDVACLYPVNGPGAVKSISFIKKGSKRFPDTNGSGYAEFTYDNASAALTDAREALGQSCRPQVPPSGVNKPEFRSWASS